MPLGATRRPSGPKTRRPAPAASLPLPSPGTRVLGVDPGLASCGWAVVEEREGRLGCVGCGDVSTYAAWPLARRLARIHDALAGAIARHQPSVLRVEDYVAYGTRGGSAVVQAAASTGQGIAIAVLAAVAAGLEVPDPVRASDWQAALGRPRGGRIADRDARKRLTAAVVRAQVAGVPADASDHAVDAVGIAASAWLGRRQQGALELAGGKRSPRRRPAGAR